MSPSAFLRVASRSLQPLPSRLLPAISQSAPFSQGAFRSFSKKNGQDRESINTESTEHTKSSTDDEAAAQNQAAYDPSRTSPESEMESAQKGNKVGCLSLLSGFD